MTNEEKLQNINKQIKEVEIIYYKLLGAKEVLTEDEEGNTEEVEKEGKSKKSK
jgi:hypothetical protein